MKRMVPIFLFVFSSTSAQVASFPYKESFDTVATPNLPSGWSTTTNRNASGDFITSTTTVRSAPNSVSSTNGKITQSLISPEFDFTAKFPDSIIFYERRTSTHISPILLGASINGDTTFSIPIGDTLKMQSSTAYVKRGFALSETLNGASNVRFRWRVVADTAAGTSGVIRFDDIVVTVKKAVDLSVSSFTIFPASPREGETVTAAITIRNQALAGIFSGTVQLFDSLTFVTSHSITQSLDANESLTVQLKYPDISAGRHQLNATLVLIGDEDTTNNTLPLTVNAGYPPRTFLINEIMYAPPPGMPEWIEIVNNSTGTIPISGWRISDAGTTRALISPNRPVDPRSYFIVTTDTNALKNFYTVETPLFHAQFSALNNSGDAVVLFDPTMSVADSLMFMSSWGGGTGGKALERVDSTIASTVQSNWQTSKHPLGATPGKINSVTQKEYDAAVAGLSVSPPLPVTGDIVTVAATLKNIGKRTGPSLIYRLYLDSNNDSLPSPSEIHYEQNIPLLNPGDSAVVTATLSSLVQGTHRVFGSVSFAQDDDTTNNLLQFSFAVGIPPQSVVITEIMYAPPGDIPEWIELYNRSNAAISLNGWKISDAGTARSPVTGPVETILPQSYFVVTADSSFTNYYSTAAPVFIASFPSLNNTTPDAVVLFDERGGRIDSVYYKPAWGGANGNSLQRFDLFGASTDSANWKSTVPNAGSENVIARKDFDVEIKNLRSENIENGTRILITLSNGGRQTANSITANLFHDINGDSSAQQGEMIHSTNVAAIVPADSVATEFDWVHSLHGKQSVIVVIEFSEDQRRSNNTGFVLTAKSFSSQSFVINEIMYEPLPGNAEFVELLSRSTDSIDVAGWKLMDQPSSTGNRAVIPLSQQRKVVPPNGYALVASDSAIFTQFPSLAGTFVIINSSLSLGNSGEDIVLADLTGTRIDSVRYSPSWHLKNVTAAGRSLERINPDVNPNDSRNWSSSVAGNGASPSHSNSIRIASSSTTSLTLTPNPFSPDNDGVEDFLSINYNLPANSATIRVRIYDVTGRLLRRLAQSEPSPSNGAVIWNGLDDDGHRVRIGMYIILFEAFDNFGGTVKTMKDVAVVARKL